MLLGKSWGLLYKSQREHKLATTGVYHYIRHPQYVAFTLIIFGFLVQWPTLITLIMAPILIFRYIRLANIEEKEVEKMFGDAYQNYANKTPAFFPKISLNTTEKFKGM